MSFSVQFYSVQFNSRFYLRINSILFCSVEFNSICESILFVDHTGDDDDDDDDDNDDDYTTTTLRRMATQAINATKTTTTTTTGNSRSKRQQQRRRQQQKQQQQQQRRQLCQYTRPNLSQLRRFHSSSPNAPAPTSSRRRDTEKARSCVYELVRSLLSHILLEAAGWLARQLRSGSQS